MLRKARYCGPREVIINPSESHPQSFLISITKVLHGALSLIDRSFHRCLTEVTDSTEQCRPGFQRLTLPLSESDECQGVFFDHYIERANGGGQGLAEKTITVDISETDIRRWQLLSTVTLQNGDPDADPEESLSDRMPNFPRLNGIRKGRSLYIGLTFTGFVYGGLHCLAWNAPFATRLETLLWRISSIAIMSTFVPVLLFYLWELWNDNMRINGPLWAHIRIRAHRLFQDPNFAGWRSSRKIASLLYFIGKATLQILLNFTVYCAAGFYCLARVYLVVECFINLAHLPDSVYQAPVWSQYVPHIS